MPDPVFIVMDAAPEETLTATYVAYVHLKTGLNPDHIYTRTLAAAANISFEEMRRKVETEDENHMFVEFEPFDSYRQAYNDQRGEGSGFAFTKRRVKYLRAKREQAHPVWRGEVVDAVCWVEGDPHAKDGIPTLFASEQAAKMYARQIDKADTAVRSSYVYFNVDFN